MEKELAGTTPSPEDNESDPKLLDQEKVNEFIRGAIRILNEGHKRGISQEELQGVVRRASEHLLSSYDLKDNGRFKTENY